MIELTSLWVILLMALSTYLTRIIGYIALRNCTLSPRMMAMLENVPGCVLISVIAPAFVSHEPSDLLALVVTLGAAACLPLLPTVLISVSATGLLRYWL